MVPGSVLGTLTMKCLQPALSSRWLNRSLMSEVDLGQRHTRRGRWQVRPPREGRRGGEGASGEAEGNASLLTVGRRG